MTAALLAIPACTAKNISNNLGQYKYTIISSITGGLACILGVGSYALLGLAIGPLIILANALLFV